MRDMALNKQSHYTESDAIGHCLRTSSQLPSFGIAVFVGEVGPLALALSMRADNAYQEKERTAASWIRTPSQ